MLAAKGRHSRSRGFEVEISAEPNPGSKTCVSHRSPRWSAEPPGPVGTSRAGALLDSGSVAGPTERLVHRRRLPSLGSGRRMYAAGGSQAGAPARSGRSTRPLCSNRLHTIRQLPLASAGSGRNNPATSPNSIPPAREAGGKEENR